MTPHDTAGLAADALDRLAADLRARDAVPPAPPVTSRCLHCGAKDVGGTKQIEPRIGRTLSRQEIYSERRKLFCRTLRVCKSHPALATTLEVLFRLGGI